MKLTNKYISLFRATILESFAYKVNFLISFLSSFTMVLVQYFIWSAVFLHRKEIASFSFKDTVTYMVMVWALYGFCNTTNFTRNFQEEILSGSISYKLLFPVNFYFYFFIKTYSRNLMNLLLTGSFIIFFSCIFFPFKIPTFNNLLLFLFSLTLSFVISFNISFLIALSSVYLKKVEGLIQLKEFINAIFSGTLLPLDFLPSYIRSLSDILPFKGIMYVPISIFIGKISNLELLFMLLFQIIWILILKIPIIYFSSVFYKKIEVFGG